MFHIQHQTPGGTLYTEGSNPAAYFERRSLDHSRIFLPDGFDACRIRQGHQHYAVKRVCDPGRWTTGFYYARNIGRSADHSKHYRPHGREDGAQPLPGGTFGRY